MKVDKSWGYEHIIVNNGIYCGKRIYVRPLEGCQFYHYHKVKHETFYVEMGAILIEVPMLNEHGIIKKVCCEGDSYEVSPGLIHKFTGLESNNIFFEFSTKDSPEDSYRIKDFLDWKEYYNWKEQSERERVERINRIQQNSGKTK